MTQLPPSGLTAGAAGLTGVEDAEFVLPPQLHNPSNPAKDIAVKQEPKMFMTGLNLARALSRRH
jgi:hypothetical protein